MNIYCRRDIDISTPVNMPLSKSTRIIILLAVDSAFFLIELTVGELEFCRSFTLLLKAQLTQSKALPYTHSPSLQTPFIWSVILRHLSHCQYLHNHLLTEMCRS